MQPTESEPGAADQNPAGKSDQGLHAPEAERPEKIRQGKKPARRHQTYEKIDEALRAFAAARPKSHKEVFRLLDERKVPIPNRRPFKSGWLNGFQQNRYLATVWLSQTWGRLGLPAFPRGPQK